MTQPKLTQLPALVLIALGGLLAGRADAAERPNIVFIFADDWGWGDLGCHGHPYLKTPNLDRLASEGTDFHQFTVASGVCSPSRAAVVTGQFPARHNIHGHFATVPSHRQRGMPDWLDPKTTLLPRLLKNAGYTTAHFGKWHLTNIMVEDAPLPSEYGYDAYGAFNCSGPQMPVFEDVDRSIQFVEKSHAEGKPFFLNLWIHEPHTPHYPKPEYLKQFSHLEDERDQIYAAVLAHADARVGQLLATLDRLELTDDTLVIFSSDNGPENTSNRRVTDDRSTGPGIGSFASVGTTGGHRGRKRSLLQGGIGVPFIARWPGRIAAGKIDDATPHTAVDLLPTFCALGGAELPEGYEPDGVDQTDALLGKPYSARDKPVFWQWNSASSRGENWPTLAVREGDWKLLLGKDPQQVELFRFPEDRLEEHDLQKERPAEVERLRALLDDWTDTLPREPDEDCFSAAREE
ncbi:Arylsulfatase [Planctomycetes bacterium LzC2]|uniref:Arylsulfatase n=1 Tax=Alienimonas chondri TaxID=2681879 RepID=A0ABX1VL30_9PLAN|nr:Arylsulfatase [Alienimonas chondri]